MISERRQIRAEETGGGVELILRTKYLRRRARWLAQSGDWGRMRPLTCFKLLGLEDQEVNPITPQSFAAARLRWISLARDYRESGETDYEKAANIAWQHLKNWRCPVCGGVKSRVRSRSCGQACGNKLRRETRLKRLGPVVLRMEARSSGLTGGRYRGHALRQAQLKALSKALEKCSHCVAETARELGMSYGTLKYYIRKFGGYIGGERRKRVGRV